MAQKVKDEDIAKLRLMGKTQKEIAKDLHTTPVTICNRIKTKEYKQIERSYRQELVEEILNGLAIVSSKALDTLTGLLDSESEHIRLKACDKVLTLLQDFTVQADLMTQVDELREVLKDKGL